MSDSEYDLLCFIEQFFMQNAKIPTKELVLEHGFSGTLYTSAIAKRSFRDGLISRGVRLNLIEGLEEVYEKEPWKKWALSEAQLACANVLLDFADTRSRSKKLTELGVSTAKYQAWLRDAAFQQYLRDRSEGALHDNQHEAHMALVDRVVTGDINAIKYFNELTGRYVPSKASNVDVNVILMRVVEVIQRHVTDPTALAGIGNELMALSESMVSPVGVIISNTAAPAIIPVSSQVIVQGSDI